MPYFVSSAEANEVVTVESICSKKEMHPVKFK